MRLDNYTLAVPVIATADVLGTVTYFEQTLGFKQQWIWGDPPVYAGVKGGQALLYICADAALATAIREKRLTPDIFLWVRDIDTVYAQHRASNADIAEELALKPWGARQYAVRDPNGYLPKIAEIQDEGDT
jgi:uncharacterized glyoxalase superfamily protein PhnB